MQLNHPWRPKPRLSVVTLADRNDIAPRPALIDNCTDTVSRRRARPRRRLGCSSPGRRFLASGSSRWLFQESAEDASRATFL